LFRRITALARIYFNTRIKLAMSKAVKLPNGSWTRRPQGLALLKPLKPYKWAPPAAAASVPVALLRTASLTAQVFSVSRTTYNNLPVYTSVKFDGAQVRTVLRNVSGNLEKFKTDMSSVCGGLPVYEKVGRFEIQGDHTDRLKHWLTSLGF
jgi:translation initiation factor 1 (eIF-1/SUI1)